jgi:type II secretory pathway component PulJ
MLITHNTQKGLTLIELMIAMILGIFVTGVIITVFSTNVRSNVENMKMIRLNQELRGAMTLITDEFKRAGYSASASVTTFMDRTIVPTTICANYSYDADGDGAVGATEYYGFRFDSVNNEVDWGSGLTGLGCSTGTWQAITDENTAKITRLKFDNSGSVNTGGDSADDAFSATSDVSIYDITVTLTGSTDLPHSTTPNDPSRTITETIRIRNEAPKD